MNFIVDYDSKVRYMTRQPRSSRGVFRRRAEGGARRGVPRLRLVTAAREVRESARQALRPGREELAAGSSGGNAGNRSASRPEIATVERREVRVPSQGTRGASQAPGLPRQRRGTRV